MKTSSGVQGSIKFQTGFYTTSQAYNTDMASWIVHLRIAENLLGCLPDLDPEHFALGNIAPDSGIPDEKWENFTPPTWVTHFGKKGHPDHPLADLEFYRQHLLPVKGKGDFPFLSFRLGYFFHLITDNLWGRKIGLPTKEKFKEQFAADKDFIWEVKKDWYGLDFIHVRDHPDCLFWRVFLNAEPELGGLDFLLPEGVSRSVAHIKQYYQRTDAEIQELYNRPYIYLSGAKVDQFVDESAAQISRIYKRLWINGISVDTASSVLDTDIYQ